MSNLSERGDMELELLNELRSDTRSMRETMARMEGKVEALTSALGKAQENGQMIAVLQSEILNLKAAQGQQRATTLAIIAIIVPTIFAVISLLQSVAHK